MFYFCYKEGIDITNMTIMGTKLNKIREKVAHTEVEP